MESREEFVEIDEAGRCAGDPVTDLVQVLESIEGGVEQVTNLAHGVGDPPLGHLEHHVLGLVDRTTHVLGT